MEQSKEIVELVNETGLGNPQADFIVSKFLPLMEDAKKLIEESKAIIVTDDSQIELMSRAKENRLALKKIRTDADKTRKELKEDVLKYGNAVQGVYNLIKDAIEPVESFLEEQEKFLENKRKFEQEKILNDRITKITPLVEDINMYNLADMSEEIFDKLYVKLQKENEDKLKAEKEAEEAEAKRLEDERKENERIRIENDKLKKDKEAEDKKKEADEKKRKEEEEIKEKEHQAQLDKERKEREKIEAELEEKKKEDARKAKEEEDRKKEKEEEERQKKLAPEKDKLFAWSEQIKSIPAPEGLSKAGLGIVKDAEAKLLAISQEIKLSLKNL